MTTPSDLRIGRLSAARLGDFLRFFDHERGPAFADNPDWAGCYCHCFHVPPPLSWDDFDATMNRRAMTARIESSEMEGYLACSGDTVVGWMNAQPYAKLRHACARMRIPQPELPVALHDAAAIVCFVVAARYRRRGVARALLEHALVDFAARGVAVVDAFPSAAVAADAAAAEHFHGTLSMFKAAGFAPIATHERTVVVRKDLRSR